MPEYQLDIDHTAPDHDRAYCMTCDNHATPAAGQVLKAGELGRRHHGWMMEYQLAPFAEGPLYGPSRRTVYLIGVRRWTNDEGARVGLLSDESGPWRGTEYHVSADTEVKLVRHIKKGIPKARKNDFPAEGDRP